MLLMASNKTAPVAEQIGDGLPSGGWLAPPGGPVPVLCCGKNVETALRTLPFIALLDNSRGLGNIKNSVLTSGIGGEKFGRCGGRMIKAGSQVIGLCLTALAQWEVGGRGPASDSQGTKTIAGQGSAHQRNGCRLQTFWDQRGEEDNIVCFSQSL